MIPYGRQSVGSEELAEIAKVLQSDFLTQGPTVERFENAVAQYCGVRFAVAVSSGTAALHAVYAAYGIGPADEIVTSPITFAATANAALYLGARPVFADTDPRTGLLDPASVASKINAKTKAIVPVDFAGAPADYESFRGLADSLGVPLIADAAHSLGASYAGKPVGTLADATIFSFHPVKTITTGEGGMIVTDRPEIAERMRRFRHHGIVRGEAIEREHGAWFYEMRELGNNYRMSDLHAAVGVAQMGKVDAFLAKRDAIALQYEKGLADLPIVRAPAAQAGTRYARHLFVIQLDDSCFAHRREIFAFLRARGIGVQVHYVPVYRHPYYRDLGYRQDRCPNAERFYAGAISLPIFPALREEEIACVIATVREAFERFVSKKAARSEAQVP